MGIFKKISTVLSGGRSSDPDGYMVYVRCSQCSETIKTRVNLMNDLSLQYGENNKSNSYFCRKVLLGTSRCFRQIEVSLTFDGNRKIIDRQITGGEFITVEEFESQEESLIRKAFP